VYHQRAGLWPGPLAPEERASRLGRRGYGRVLLVRRHRPRGRLRGPFDPRQVHAERGALSRLGLHPDVAAALVHDAVYRGETQPGPLALVLGREERLEEMALGLAVHVDTAVAHLEHHVRARR